MQLEQAQMRGCTAAEAPAEEDGVQGVCTEIDSAVDEREDECDSADDFVQHIHRSADVVLLCAASFVSSLLLVTMP